MQLLEAQSFALVLEPQQRRTSVRTRACTGRPRKASPPALTLTDSANALPSKLFIPGPAAATYTADSKEALFRSLVKDYGSSLYYFVLKRVRHPDEAADIAQQAFVEAACSFTSYRGEAEISTWIFGIATNLARNHISRAPQNRHRFESDEVLGACESPDLQPCDSLSQRQGLHLVTEAMGLMAPEMARALNLVAVEEMSYEEAAIELDVPVGTVRSRVSRARAAVRQHLRASGYLAAA